MPSLDWFHRSSSHGVAIPACAHCHKPGSVHEVRLQQTPLEACNLIRAFKTVLRDAGLPRVRFHDLRHTAATFLLAQGVDARTIMEMLGHSQISLTLDTYSHVLPSLQRDAAERMNRLLIG
jgi:integrase